MSRSKGRSPLRTAGAAVGVAAAISSSLLLSAGTASSATLGTVEVTPRSGGVDTLFGGVIDNAQCPAGTTDSFFEVVGDDIGQNDDNIGFLGFGTSAGTGRQEFAGASIANLRTTNSGSFTGDGEYVVRFVCIDAAGVRSDSYDAAFSFVDNTWEVGQEPTPEPTSTATATPSPTRSATPSPTTTRTATASPSSTASPSPTVTDSPSATGSPTASPSPTVTDSPSATASPTASPSGAVPATGGVDGSPSAGVSVLADSTSGGSGAGSTTSSFASALPRTGSLLANLLFLAAAAAVAGGLLVAYTRRRPAADGQGTGF